MRNYKIEICFNSSIRIKMEQENKQRDLRCVTPVFPNKPNPNNLSPITKPIVSIDNVWDLVNSLSLGFKSKKDFVVLVQNNLSREFNIEELTIQAESFGFEVKKSVDTRKKPVITWSYTFVKNCNKFFWMYGKVGEEEN